MKSLAISALLASAVDIADLENNAPGMHQSPIAISSDTFNGTILDTGFAYDYGKLSFDNALVKGHGMQFVLPDEKKHYLKTSVVKQWYYKAKDSDMIFHPAQFHFHMDEKIGGGEHTLEGKYYPLEMHIVHKAEPQNDKFVASVVGIMFSQAGPNESASFADSFF